MNIQEKLMFFMLMVMGLLIASATALLLSVEVYRLLHGFGRSIRNLIYFLSIETCVIIALEDIYMVLNKDELKWYK